MGYDDVKKINIYDDSIPELIYEYLRDEELTTAEIEQYWVQAVNYIEQYTARTRKDLEQLPQLTHVLLALCSDMHDNRSFSGDRTYINQLVDSILGLHRFNMIG